MSLLPDAESFKRIVSGADSSARGRLSRALLGPLGAAWTGVMAARNAAYDAGLFAAHAAPVPVVSVGNLSLGGTGKTPLVAWVAGRLLRAGHSPAIVSRGYGAARGTVSDEAAELALLLPGVPHVADADRVAGARTAARAGAGVVVLDDGFQHRRLHRDLDLVAIDATDPFGCGHVFPRGLLRERLAGLSRAHAAILTRATAVPPERRDAIRARLAEACAGRVPGVWAEASHAPVALRDGEGNREDLGWLAGRDVVGFAGIGNPAAFRDTLHALGARPRIRRTRRMRPSSPSPGSADNSGAWNCRCQPMPAGGRRAAIASARPATSSSEAVATRNRSPGESPSTTGAMSAAKRAMRRRRPSARSQSRGRSQPPHPAPGRRAGELSSRSSSAKAVSREWP